MELVQTLDDFGKPAWITLMIVSFIVFWPLGLGVLFYLMWSGRMGCKSHDWERRAKKRWRRAHAAFRSTGNAAFDEYREETLRRLEQEANEFQDFLKRLRAARDKAEFDQFMAERGKPRDDSAHSDANRDDRSEEAPGAVPQTG